MWYNARPVTRRGLCLTLLVLVAVQLLGAVAVPSGCLEPCPEDSGESDCPPICATCATCAHSRQALLQTRAEGDPASNVLHAVATPGLAPDSLFAADIFHVPLAG